MNRKTMIAGGLLLAGLALWLGVREAVSSARRTAGDSGNDRQAAVHFPGESDGSPARKTKVSDRTEVRRATHVPERLREFLLPPMEIRGLSLQAALAKLLAAYEDACLISGESPLRLKFTLPPGFDARVNANLGNSNLDGSIRLLAGLAGLTVRRDGAEYLFEIPEAFSDGQPRKIEVPPDFGSQLQRLVGITSVDSSEVPRSTLQETLARLGILNNPGAVRLTGLTLTTPDAKDHAILKALLNSMASDSPIQYRVEPKIVSIPAGTDIDIPEGTLDTAGMGVFMRELATRRGVDLLTMPSATARPGETANIDIIRELIAPTDASGQEFETHETGVKLGITATGIGFGQQLDVNFSAVTGDIDPATGLAKISVDASIEESAWSPDAAARPLVQTHPDGSRILVLVAPTLVDATGRPMKEPD